MSSSHHHGLAVVSALVAALSAQSACTHADAPVHGKVVLIDRTTQALLGADLLSVNGTYGAGCTARMDEWSAPISVGATLDYDELSVVVNDVACVLTMTQLRTTTGVIAAVPAIELTAAYQATPSSFAVPIEFYANARLDALTFATDFVLEILYSDDPRLAVAEVVATYAVAESSVTAMAVPAPNYTLSVAALSVMTDVNDVVQSVTGSLALTTGSVPGQRYVVLSASELDTYEEVHAAYTAATDLAIVLSIPASELALVGVDLTGAPAVRTLIIANTDADSGVPSYQVFAITFREPA